MFRGPSRFINKSKLKSKVHDENPYAEYRRHSIYQIAKQKMKHKKKGEH